MSIHCFFRKIRHIMPLRYDDNMSFTGAISQENEYFYFLYFKYFYLSGILNAGFLLRVFFKFWY